MTVSYTTEVATSNFSCFPRLLFRWKGSIYKLMWKEFAIFAFMYYLLGFTYRFVLPGHGKKWFEDIANYCHFYNNRIPISFVLGFYVSLVVGRFYEQFNSLPWPSRMALFVSTLIHGYDDRSRLIKRTIVRYLSTTYVLTMCAICPSVKKRFPTLKHMIDAGLMLESEQKILDDLDTKSNKYFVPLIWAANLVSMARREGRVKDDFAVKTLVDEINNFRGKCGGLLGYDWVTVPLVYTQVVSIAVYTFFLSCLMGRQRLDNDHDGDQYFPLFTFLEFFFYMGWLKVAESLLNPFGEDDNDFEINTMIDGNLQTSYLIVDGANKKMPELVQDQHWDKSDIELPYTQSTQQYQKEEFAGSAANIDISEIQSQFNPILSITPQPLDDIKESIDESARQISIDSEHMDGKRRKGSSLGSSSFLSVISRSLSRSGRRQQEAGGEEAGSMMMSSLKPTKISKNPSSATNRSNKEEMIFEMSDDDGSISGAKLTRIQEESPKTMTEFGEKVGKDNRPLIGSDLETSSYRSQHSMRSPDDQSVKSHESKFQADNEFHDFVKDQLKVLRDGDQGKEHSRSLKKSDI